MAKYEVALLNHYQRLWGSPIRQHLQERGPIHHLPLGFLVLEFKGGSQWKYATVGLGPVCGMEFFVVAPEQNGHHVQTLAVVSHYAITGPGLGWGHTVFLGEGWLPGSGCDHLLLSKPHADNAGLESFQHDGRMVRCLWLLPITREEREFKIRCGLEALESIFEDESIDYANPLRTSLV
tara:strand:+ start:36560 stop:37096 length:537 start_codon:yes stop_codon:yes gene_type:complete